MISFLYQLHAKYHIMWKRVWAAVLWETMGEQDRQVKGVKVVLRVLNARLFPLGSFALL